MGDANVGKSSIRRRYLGQNFDKEYLVTLGADFAVKAIEVDNKNVVLQIWDLAGQERFSIVRDKYYMNSSGLILVYDLTSKSSFENIPNWIEEYMKNTDNFMVPLLIVGNKIDLCENNGSREILQEEIENYINVLREWGKNFPHFDIEYVETSAKTCSNIESAFKSITEMMLNNML